MAKGQKPDAISFHALTGSEFRIDNVQGYSVRENYLRCARKANGDYVAENILHRGKVSKYGKYRPNGRIPPWKEREMITYIKGSLVSQLVSMLDSNLYDKEVFIDTLGNESKTWSLFKSEGFVLKNMSIDSFGYSSEQLYCICESAKQKQAICSHQSHLNRFIAQFIRDKAPPAEVFLSTHTHWVQLEICFGRDTTFLRLNYPDEGSFNWRVSYSHSPTVWWLMNPKINELVYEIIPSEVTDRSYLLSFKKLFIDENKTSR